MLGVYQVRKGGGTRVVTRVLYIERNEEKKR